MSQDDQQRTMNGGNNVTQRVIGTGKSSSGFRSPNAAQTPPPVVECFCGCFACGSLIACAISPIYGPFSVVISCSRCSCSASRNGSSQAQDEVFNVFILSRWWCVSKLSQRQRRYCADSLESAELLRESRHQVAVRFSWTSRR